MYMCILNEWLDFFSQKKSIPVFVSNPFWFIWVYLQIFKVFSQDIYNLIIVLWVGC